MLATAFSLVLRLPPLAFGPELPPAAFAPPRALVCDIHELGRLRAPAGPLPARSALGPLRLRPAADRHLVNPLVDGLLLMGLVASTHGSWDERTWSTRNWEATGAITPVLIPMSAPPPRGGPW